MPLPDGQTNVFEPTGLGEHVLQCVFRCQPEQDVDVAQSEVRIEHQGLLPV